MGLGEILFILILLTLAAFPIWGIVDAASRPDSVWARADQNKIVWVLLQIFLGGIGALVYFIAIRPKLRSLEFVSDPTSLGTDYILVKCPACGLQQMVNAIPFSRGLCGQCRAPLHEAAVSST